MIIYFDRPNVNFINSIIEYDLIKKLRPEYTLNLITSDKNKAIENNDEKQNQNYNSQSYMNINSIQRELIKLLSYDFDSISNDFEKLENEEKQFKDNSKNNSTKSISIQNQNNDNNSPIPTEDIKNINNSLFNNGINNNFQNINNPMNINMNIQDRINTQLNKNLNEKMGANIGVNIGENMGDKINNSIYINKNIGINNNGNDKIWNNFNYPYKDFYNNSFINRINNKIPFNINNLINNNNNFRVNNNKSIITDLKYNNNDNNYFNINSFHQQNKTLISFPSESQLINFNNYDDNHINNINNVMNNNFQNMVKTSNLNNININNNINNNNYINNLNFNNNINYLNNTNNIYNINNKSNNNFEINSYIKENKYSKMSLYEITNKLDIIAKKQPGCRFLESLIKTNENSYEIINNIFYPKLYWVKLYELCNDLFGNYFIQTIIPKLNDINMISFTNLVNNNLLKLSLNPHGTRVVQVLIENIKDNKNNLLLIFTNYLSKIMDKLINDLNGSFVLMHYAKEINDNNIIYNFLNNNIIEISTKPYSCSALQKFIDLGTNNQKSRLINNIINITNCLMGSQCGLYVLQFIMDKRNYQFNDSILNTFINNLINLAKQKYSSNVIEKCLETCSPKMVNKLITILNKEMVIRELIKNMFGNYVIQKLLIVCKDDKIRNHILAIISSEFNELRNLPFGNKLIKKLMMTYPQIKSKL